MKKILKKSTKIGLFLGLILSIPLLVYAATDIDWSDGEKREEAWLIYLMTEWNNVGDLTFTEDGSYSKTSVSDSFLEKYQSIVAEALGECTQKGHYTPSSYQNLILTMMYYMQKEADDNDDTDIACIKEYINPDASVGSKKESVKLLYNRICECESAYNSVNPNDPCDIFQNNEQLQGMIQSVIYPGYNQLYTKKTAKEYYKELDNDDIKKYHDFASDVADKYQAVKANTKHPIITG